MLGRAGLAAQRAAGGRGGMAPSRGNDKGALSSLGLLPAWSPAPLGRSARMLPVPSRGGVRGGKHREGVWKMAAEGSLRISARPYTTSASVFGAGDICRFNFSVVAGRMTSDHSLVDHFPAPAVFPADQIGKCPVGGVSSCFASSSRSVPPKSMRALYAPRIVAWILSRSCIMIMRPSSENLRMLCFR